MPYHVDRDEQLIKNIKESLKDARDQRAATHRQARIGALGSDAKEALQSIDAIARRPKKDSAALLQRRLDEIAAITKEMLRKYR